jgi:Membrane bound beta barrel domain (DUF5777)/Putative Ig domain
MHILSYLSSSTLLLACVAIAPQMYAAETPDKTATTATKPAPRVFPAQGEVGKPFAFSLNFKNKPDHFEFTNLPPGLTGDRDSGVISGVPTRAGVTSVTLSAVNSKGRGNANIVITVKKADIAVEQVEQRTEVSAPTASTSAIITTTSSDEEDVADPNAAVAAVIPRGDWYYRIVHTGTAHYYDDWRTDFIGLDDGVKIGMLLGYGLAENWDIFLQRTNGYDLQIDTDLEESTRFDYYDVMTKYKLLDQFDGALDYGGLLDMAVTGGVTVMQRNQGISQISYNVGVLAERNFFHDRLRLGTGLMYSSISAYEGGEELGPSSKLFSDEYDYLVADAAKTGGDPPSKRDPASTSAVPIVVVLAVSTGWQLYGEAIFPISGYETNEGPSMIAGARYNTNTHQYSIYFTNTGNVAVNSVITGGMSSRNLPLFGFYITSFF